MNPHACFNFSRPVSRREALQKIGIGFGATALSGLLGSIARGQSVTPAPHAPVGNLLGPQAARIPANTKRVIFLFMHGGPSAVDSFDYKPALEKADGQTAPKLPKVTFAAANGREGSKLWKSPWAFAPQGKSGHMVSELFPQLGGLADEMCFLHSCHGNAPDHGAAVLRMNTGTEAFVRPSMGAWTLYGLGSENENLPGFITLSLSEKHGGVRNYGSAFLPAQFQGTPLGNQNTRARDARFRFLGAPNDPAQRRQLDFLRELNTAAASDLDHELSARIATYEMAFKMQVAAPEVLDLSKESAATRASYGLDDPVTADFGTQCLLARRFAEAGVRYIQVSTGFKWDQHGGLVKGHTDNARATDQPCAALLRDLKQRGLLDDTLVLWGGEFGRTPTREGGDGRDHNPHGYTMWMAGAGVRAGTRVGATDDLGYNVVEDKVTVRDFQATLLHLTGFDPYKLSYRYQGLNQRLIGPTNEGQIVKALLS